MNKLNNAEKLSTKTSSTKLITSAKNSLNEQITTDNFLETVEGTQDLAEETLEEISLLTERSIDSTSTASISNDLAVLPRKASGFRKFFNPISLRSNAAQSAYERWSNEEYINKLEKHSNNLIEAERKLANLELNQENLFDKLNKLAKDINITDYIEKLKSNVEYLEKISNLSCAEKELIPLFKQEIEVLASVNNSHESKILCLDEGYNEAEKELLMLINDIEFSLPDPKIKENNLKKIS